MTNEQEAIDGVKGEWRTVTNASEVTVGQRVRMIGQSACFGYDVSLKQVVTSIKGKRVFVNNFDNIDDDLLDGYWKQVQAFFPLPVRKSRKVAKVHVRCDIDNEADMIWYIVVIRFETYKHRCDYTSYKNAIRGAKRFCKAIGYECEIVK